jgi:hypothetical protein
VLNLRCSRLPLLSKCAAASIPPVVRVERDDAAARLGTAVHACLKGVIEFGACDYAEVAGLYRVDPDDVSELTALGVLCWRQVADYFPMPVCEVELRYQDNYGVLTGHSDVMSLQDSAAWVADFKTGRADEDYTDQLMGYALLACEARDVDEAHVCLIRVRERTADWEHYNRDQLVGWWRAFAKRLRDEAELYRPGRHCGYCPRFHECPGAASHLTLASEFLLSASKAGCSPLAFGTDRAKQVAYTYDRVRLLESVCESVREEIRAEVRRAGGVLPTGDGRELVITHQERKAIDYRPAYAVLRSTLGLDRLESLLKVKLSDVSEAVREHAPRGHKAKAVTELKARLEEAGAMNVTTVERLEVRRSLPQIESE